MKCIYCLESDRVTFRGVEHVIPQAFGTFGANTPTLDCVCDDCNKYFGQKLDQLLSRETIEGISRYARGQLSGETRAQRRLEITLADDPENGPYAGLKVFIDGQTGQLMLPRPQFHVFNFKTNKNEVYFLEDISGLTLPDDIYGSPGKDGVPGTWKMKAFGATKEEYESLIAALQANGIEFRAGAPFEPLAGIQDASGGLPTALVAVEGEVDAVHRRALAKILMNFVTWTLAAEEALQPRWDFLRKYVRYGEGEIKWRMSPRPFWDGQETDTLSFVDDSIDVRIENLGTNIVGSIRFYARETYQLILGENEALPPHAQVGCRFTPGIEPIPGAKLPKPLQMP
jgi:hypothetical protein